MGWLIRRASQVAALATLAVATGCAGAPNSGGSHPGPAGMPTSRATAPSQGSSGSDGPTSRSGRTPKPKIKSPFVGLASYVAQTHCYIGAAAYDPRTGQTFVFDSDPGVPERTASIVKVEIMGTLFREHEVSGQPLSQSEESLLTTMIENGGAPAIQRFDDSIGMTGTTASTDEFIPGSTDLPGWGWTTTTARDQLTVVKDFAFANKWIHNTYRLQGLYLMENVEADQDWGVSSGVPSGVTVALKNGWLPINVADNTDWQIDSIGWVKGDGRDYVLAILSQGAADYDDGVAIVDHIGAYVYDAMGSN
jgi:beta-lactamase class A